ncbi:MAG: hypothetical protein ACRD0P_08875 [Stackebrandtia sp.]
MSFKERRIRRGLRWWAALVGGLLIAAAAGCTTADKSSAETGPPDDGKPTVVESGLTDPGKTYDAEEGKIREVAFGAIVENTSKTRSIESVTVKVKFVDAHGKQITIASRIQKSDKATMHLIRPGKQVAFGSTSIPLIGDTAAKKVRLTISDVKWFSSEAEIPKVSVGKVTCSMDGTRTVKVGFTIDNGAKQSSETEDIDATAIFRSETGDIVAGQSERYVFSASGKTEEYMSVTTGLLQSYIDIDVTEVYLT